VPGCGGQAGVLLAAGMVPCSPIGSDIEKFAHGAISPN